MKTFFDAVCAWPYYQPYGEVPVPKVKRKRKARRRNPYSALIARPPKNFAATFTEAGGSGRCTKPDDERQIKHLIKLLRR